MALKISRLGYLGLGIESTPGTAVPATTTVPFIANTIIGKHEYIGDISARASRAQNYYSVLGKQWGEGELTVNVDTLNAGFILKLATGTEIVNTISTNVYDHIFYTTVSGNTPLTATLYQNQGVDTQIFPSMAVDKIDIEIKDALMTAKAAFKGFFPTSGSHTPTTVSGTLLSFANYNLKFGSSLITAASAAATPVTDFKLTFDNHAEAVFESGQPRTTRVVWKELKISGEFTQFFENATLRDDYLNLNKKSLILTASGIGLSNGYTESLTINLAKIAYKDTEITTGLENFYAIKTQFDAEVDVLQGKLYDIVLRNFRSTAYA